MVKRKTKSKKKLLLTLYPSGTIGRGKKRTKVVTSTLTPKQYEKRFYGSSYHFNTEAALTAKLLKK